MRFEVFHHGLLGRHDIIAVDMIHYSGLWGMCFSQHLPNNNHPRWFGLVLDSFCSCIVPFCPQIVAFRPRIVLLRSQIVLFRPQIILFRFRTVFSIVR